MLSHSFRKPAEVVAGIDHVVAVLRATAVPEEALRLSVIARKPAVLPWGVTLVTEAFGTTFCSLVYLC
jgi:hypothetical protein